MLNKASNHLKYEPFFHLSLKGFHHEVRPMSETFATHLNFSYWNQVYNEMSFFYNEMFFFCFFLAGFVQAACTRVPIKELRSHVRYVQKAF